MKKLIVLCIATFAIMLTGCNRGKIAEMENELANLRNEKHVADSLQNEFYGFLNEIENNLAEIKAKERIVSQTANEKPQNMQEKILSDLTDIGNLMEKNRQRLNELESLRRQLREAKVSAEQLKKMQEMIDALTTRIEEQEAEIAELQEKLKIANEQIVELRDENRVITEDNERKQIKIDEQVIALNTGFYTIGTQQALKTAGVITAKGGFIGIGKTNIVNEGADLKNFTKIDIREFRRLETNSEKIELVTPHAPESFRINDENKKNLVIEVTNPDVFWKSSKFLVVRVK